MNNPPLKTSLNVLESPTIQHVSHIHPHTCTHAHTHTHLAVFVRLLRNSPDHLGSLLRARNTQHFNIVVVSFGTVVCQRCMQPGQVGGHTATKWIAGKNCNWLVQVCLSNHLTCRFVTVQIWINGSSIFTWSHKLATPVVSWCIEDDPAFLILEGEGSGQVDHGPQSDIIAQQREGAEHNAWGLINYQVGIGYPVDLKHK